MPIERIESGVAPAKARLVAQELSDTTDVAATNSLQQVFTPPKGRLWEIVGMYLNTGAPPGAASGVHEFVLRTGDISLITGRSVFGSAITWNHSHWQVADSAKLPADAVTTLLAIINTAFSNDEPIKIDYTNGTDVNASGTRTLRFYIKETPIA